MSAFLAAPTLSRAPLVEESLASHYWTSIYTPLAISLAGALALLQPVDPASLAAAVARGDTTWAGESRGSKAAFDAVSAAAYMATTGEPLVEALGVALLPLRPVDVHASAVLALAIDGPIAVSARASAATLSADAAYAQARGPMMVESISLASSATLHAGAVKVADEAREAHAGAGIEGEGEQEISPEQLEEILKPFRK